MSRKVVAFIVSKYPAQTVCGYLGFPFGVLARLLLYNTVEPGVNMGKAQKHERMDMAMDMENCLYYMVR